MIAQRKFALQANFLMIKLNELEYLCCKTGTLNSLGTVL